MKKLNDQKVKDDTSQERMERRPLGLLQALLQSTGLVGPLAGERPFLILDWDGALNMQYFGRALNMQYIGKALNAMQCIQVA